MNSNNGKRSDVKDVISKLSELNDNIAKTMELLPTNDDKVLARLDFLFNSMPGLLYAKTTIERGSMLYEQAIGRAMSLKERYNYKMTHGELRKRR